MNTSPPSESIAPLFHMEWEKSSLLIRPSYKTQGINPIEFQPFLLFMEQIVRNMLPSDLISSLNLQNNPVILKEKIGKLIELLPIVTWNELNLTPGTLCVSFLCPAEFTNGVGRYLCDIFCRWLVPGKFLNITSAQSLNFKFIAFPKDSFYLQQIMIDISDENELLLCNSNIKHLVKEARLNVMSVKHARQIIATKKLSLEEKKIIIQENIASILERPLKSFDHNAFDQMHHFLVHLSSEDRLSHIKDQFAPFLQQRPKVFDRDVFNEIKHSVLLFQNRFTAPRSLRHVSKIISYQYLFRKSLQKAVIDSPHERHLSLKIMKMQLADPSSKNGKKNVLSIIGGINVLRESELFEERHVVEAIQRSLKSVQIVENSFIIDRRSHDPIRTFYIEIEKENGMSFLLNEVKDLRRQLPLEIKDGVESVIHPVFMPRNEEEIMRNILILSQQLKYIHDIPQVIITFDQQTEEELCFTVILLRLLKSGPSASIAQFFQHPKTDLKIESLEIKNVGTLRRKYIKEANVFCVKMEKRPFLRKDYSLDLFRARLALSSELNNLFGGIRDFNGGILSKQQEVFQELRDSIPHIDSSHDFLLENFFYSISPPLRQTLLPSAIIGKLFQMQQEALQADYKQQPFFLKAYADEQFLLVLAASFSSAIKDDLIAAVSVLEIPSSELSFSHVHVHEITCIGYIYHNRNPLDRSHFYDAISDALHNCKK